jgi:hypothetical protein
MTDIDSLRQEDAIFCVYVSSVPHSVTVAVKWMSGLILPVTFGTSEIRLAWILMI